MGRFSYDWKYNSDTFFDRIRHLSDDELSALKTEISSDRYEMSYNTEKCVALLDEIVAVQTDRHEYLKRDELRNALIAFLKSNTHLGRSLEYAADRIANAIENAGGSFSASVDQIGSIVRDLETGIADSELPELISEMRQAITLRLNDRRRLR